MSTKKREINGKTAEKRWWGVVRFSTSKWWQTEERVEWALHQLTTERTGRVSEREKEWERERAERHSTMLPNLIFLSASVWGRVSSREESAHPRRAETAGSRTTWHRDRSAHTKEGQAANRTSVAKGWRGQSERGGRSPIGQFESFRLVTQDRWVNLRLCGMMGTAARQVPCACRKRD